MDSNKRYYLSDFSAGTRCVVYKVHGHGGFRHRITEMGFVRNEIVTVIKQAPFKDPIEYEIMGSHISLRKSEAQNIEVIPLDSKYHTDFIVGTIEEHVQQEVIQRQHEIYVALLGNPNCGKTTFFNYLTGLHEKVGNYSGVTIDIKEGIYRYHGYTIHVIDLPGTYSLSGSSPDEECVITYLNANKPDIVLNIADAGNIERNLYLTTQLIDLNPQMILALNMYEELEKRGMVLNCELLGQLFGFPVVPISAKSGKGIDQICKNIIDIYENKGKIKHIHINYGTMVENAINAIKNLLYANVNARDVFPGRYFAIQLLDGDKKIYEEVSQFPNYKIISEETAKWKKELEKEYNDDIHTVIAEMKYGFIRGALRETMTETNPKQNRIGLSYSMDNLLTNKWFGLPILLCLLWVTFQVTFSVGGIFQEWLQIGLNYCEQGIANHMPDGTLKELLIEGILKGVGGVLIFLPNILILFFFISIFEDTGYMARVAFLMDKLMHKVGLHGKSFIPYILGFGCTVPAIMGTRILENPKDRILTAVTVPFVSCSTRFSVYLLFINFFFHSAQALLLLVIYIFGIIIALGTAFLLNKFVFHSANDSFVMELPPYRLPSLKNTMVHMWDKAGHYIKQVGTVIFLCSVIIWSLSYFPHEQNSTMSEKMQLEQSYMGKLGQVFEPIFRPMGLEWQESIALLTGISAKEIIITTLNILYNGDLKNSHLTPISSFALLIFILLYSPCIAAISTIARQTNKRWAIFSIIYSSLIAWICATAFYQIGSLFVNNV